MRRTIPMLLCVFCIAIQGIWAQNTIDFTVAKDTVLCLERMEWLAYQGKKIESNLMIGFSQNKLASVLSTDAEFFIFVYQLKK